MKEVKAFNCDHCSMVSLYKGNVKHHEENFCRKSPARRACSLCINFKIDFDGPFCEEDRGDII